MNLGQKLIAIVAISYLIGFFTLDYWENRLYNGDSSGYYTHVVSFFVNQDVGDYDKTLTSLLEASPHSLDPRTDKYGIRKTEKGRYYIKYTLGVGIMETPTFLIAHAYAKMSNKYKADGWSLPYMLMVNLSPIIYIVLGLYFLAKILQRYFSNQTVALTILSVALATNLFYQATYTTMAHSFLFFDFCALIYLTIRFYDSPNYLKAFGIGAVVGLITITRVPEVVGILVPLFWGIYNLETLKKRINFIKNNFGYYLLAAVGLALVFSPQIMYWYYVSGQLIFNPYQGEGFNFLKPDILNGWFNCSNGWLVYTPIMACSLIGWFFLRKRAPEAQLAVLSFVGLNAWIHYSYYVWNYYPGLGSRPMVETYPLLAFGLAAFFATCFNVRAIKWLPIVIFIFFTWLNLFQTWQLKKGIIWTERSNQAFFWETFGTMTPTIESLRSYDSKQHQPDTSDLEFIQTIHFEGFEDSTLLDVSKDIKYAGQYALFDTIEFPNCKMEARLKEINLQPKDWIYVGVKAYRRQQDMAWDRDNLEMLLVQLFNEADKGRKWTQIKIASHLGNEDHSIWSSGRPDQWGEAGFFVQIPKNANENWKLNVSIWNPGLKKIFIDNFHVEHYRER